VPSLTGQLEQVRRVVVASQIVGLGTVRAVVTQRVASQSTARSAACSYRVLAAINDTSSRPQRSGLDEYGDKQPEKPPQLTPMIAKPTDTSTQPRDQQAIGLQGAQDLT
jgi:hypothetical protein